MAWSWTTVQRFVDNFWSFNKHSFRCFQLLKFAFLPHTRLVIKPGKRRQQTFWKVNKLTMNVTLGHKDYFLIFFKQSFFHIKVIRGLKRTIDVLKIFRTEFYYFYSQRISYNCLFRLRRPMSSSSISLDMRFLIFSASLNVKFLFTSTSSNQFICQTHLLILLKLQIFWN